MLAEEPMEAAPQQQFQLDINNVLNQYKQRLSAVMDENITLSVLVEQLQSQLGPALARVAELEGLYEPKGRAVDADNEPVLLPNRAARRSAAKTKTQTQ